MGDAAEVLTLLHDFFRIIREDALKMPETLNTERICRIAAHAEIVASKSPAVWNGCSAKSDRNAGV